MYDMSPLQYLSKIFPCISKVTLPGKYQERSCKGDLFHHLSITLMALFPNHLRGLISRSVVVV